MQKCLAETLKNNGFKIYSDGTDTHLNVSRFKTLQC